MAGRLAWGYWGWCAFFRWFCLPLLGGIVADTYDRRRLMIWTQSAATLIAIILAAVTLSGRATVGIIYVLTAASAAAIAFDSPARSALVVNLVPTQTLDQCPQSEHLGLENRHGYWPSPGRYSGRAV